MQIRDIAVAFAAFFALIFPVLILLSKLIGILAESEASRPLIPR